MMNTQRALVLGSVTLLLVLTVHLYVQSKSEQPLPAVQTVFACRAWTGLHPGNTKPIPRCAPSTTKKYAYVTMLLTETYTTTVMKLQCSLKKTGTTYPLLALVPKNFSGEVVQQLEANEIKVVPVEVVQFPNKCLGRFSVNWTKLKLWTLLEYDKLVYLDGDTFVVENVDELFDLPIDFAIAGDMDRTECYTHGCGPLGTNQAGVFVFRPCQAIFDDMLSHVAQNETLQFRSSDAEQGFLNWYFYFSRMLLPPKYNFIPHRFWNTSLRDSGFKILHYTWVKPFEREYHPYHDYWINCTIRSVQ